MTRHAILYGKRYVEVDGGGEVQLAVSIPVEWDAGDHHAGGGAWVDTTSPTKYEEDGRPVTAEHIEERYGSNVLEDLEDSAWSDGDVFEDDRGAPR